MYTRSVKGCFNISFRKMVKRKASKSDRSSSGMVVPPVHDFRDTEIKNVRSKLLEWYQENKRDLPWRKQINNADINQRAYAVWVSEIMLQQTQVATVIDYYNKWMKNADGFSDSCNQYIRGKWPTVQDLAKASLEEVNEMWSGLGYYSRGRRLHEGAKKVVEHLNGEIPNSAESLLRELPGVGKYTAGAIASIAFNEVTGLVDGNVIRVFCRLRMIGADTNSQSVTAAMWDLANSLVDTASPGDFNQGLMELGATVCVPKGPSCSSCPLRLHCKAYAQVEKQKDISASRLGKKSDKEEPVLDIECLADDCALCLPLLENWEPSDGVMNYPRKGKKKAAREERTAVCILCRKTKDVSAEYFIVQRPESGLLAGLWEFPSQLLESENSSDPTHAQCLNILKKYGISINRELKSKNVGEAVHIFSHIHQTYCVRSMTVDLSDITIATDSNQAARWVTKQQFLDAAISTAMKKVFRAFESSSGGKTDKKQMNKTPAVSNQRSIASFFKPTV